MDPHVAESPVYRAPTAAAPSYRPHAATLIAKGVKLEGDFASQGDVQIEGDVQGKISAAGTLTVGAEATITADVTADEAVISGVLNGNLHITRQLVLHSGARIKGDIVAERISVEAGAVIDGRVEIGTRQPKSDATVPPATIPETEIKIEPVAASTDEELKVEGEAVVS